MKKSAAIFLLILVLAAALCACSEAYKISFETSEITVKSGVSFLPNIIVRPKREEYSVVSSNNTIAKAENNVVTALKEGVVTLTATSGGKSATCTLYVRDDVESNASGVTILDTHVVGFEIVNYELAGLETGRLEGVIAIEGSFINVSVPNIPGYSVDCWYTDMDCTQKYAEETRVYSSFTLYAKLTERETSYHVVNGYISGLVYPNLKHEELVLPEKEENGGVIYGIADNAFKGDKTIKKVVIPASYRTIGTSAFAGCSELTEVVIPEDSELHTVGTNAFGRLLDDKGQMTDSCEKLSVFNLPDTVTRLGSFAFYGCKSLDFDGIPSNLTILEQYVFSYTGINNVSLKNINALYEGVFSNCNKLDTVTDTENVTMCDKSVFEGTKLTDDARAKYNKSRKDDDAAFYAGTILYGCYPAFGRTVGSGKLHIKEDTTLIADEAFNGANQTELTVYLDTVAAAAAINRDFIGRNVFRNTEGVFIVVGEGLSARYKERYSVNERDYAAMIAEEEKIIVAEYNNADEINWGTHIILKKSVSGGGYRYFYDKFVPFADGTPRIIRIGDLRIDGQTVDIERVNMNAFTNIAELANLELYRVRKIAYFGVTNCRNLKRIDLTKTISPTKLEDKSSIQFSSIHADAKVYVSNGQLSVYKSRWAAFSTAAGRLAGE